MIYLAMIFVSLLIATLVVGIEKIAHPKMSEQEGGALRHRLENLEASYRGLRTCCDNVSERLDELERDLKQGLNTAQWALEQLQKRVNYIEGQQNQLRTRIEALEASGDE